MIQIAKSLDQIFINISEDIKMASEEILFSFRCNVFPIKIFEHKQQNTPLKRIDILENAILYGYVNLKKISDDKNNVEARFTESSETFQQFSLVDGKSISFLNPDMSAVCVGQSISNKHLGSKYKTKFFDLYQNAIPANFVVAEIENQKKNMLNHASQELNLLEMTFLNDIIDYGMFTSHTDKEKEFFMQNKRLKKFIQKINNNVIANFTLNAALIRTNHATKK